jgi:hypothetical protein
LLNTEKVRYEREEFKQSKKDYLRDYICHALKNKMHLLRQRAIDATVAKN